VLVFGPAKYAAAYAGHACIRVDAASEKAATRGFYAYPLIYVNAGSAQYGRLLSVQWFRRLSGDFIDETFPVI
jgi:hypothetical protein